MILLRDSWQLAGISHPAIRQLVALRFQQLAPPGDLNAPCSEFIVVEAGDAASDIEQAVGISILHSLFDDLPFGHPDYHPPCELIERHTYEDGSTFFELFVLASDSGAGTAVFVPDEEAIDASLLAMCRSWSTPGMSTR